LPLDDEVIFWSLLGKKAAEAKNFQWAKAFMILRVLHNFEAADNRTAF